MDVKRGLGLRPDLVAATIALVLPGLVIALWIAPRAATPTDMPALALPSDHARALIEDDRARAVRAPDGEAEERRRTLYRAQGIAELRGELASAAAERRDELHSLLEALGDEEIAALRARDVERTIAAIGGTGSDIERAEELGQLPASLTRWGAIVDGRRIASELVIRTMAAARWNLIHGRAPTDGFGVLRLRAYHGWLALHGDGASAEMRASALDAYEASGGTDADEARAILAWRAGDTERAIAAFERAYERTGNVRFRNHALAVALAVE